MGSLNIKSDETYRLVRELSELTGENMTAAVTAAVRERLERLRGKRSAEQEDLIRRLRAIAHEAAASMTEEERRFDYDAWLYDENGLPR